MNIRLPFAILHLLLSACLLAGWTDGAFAQKGPAREKSPAGTPASNRGKSSKSIRPASGTPAETNASADSLFFDATTLFLTERPQEALEAYRLLLEKEPGNATAAYQIANILASAKQFSQALAYAEKACALEPGNEWFQFLLAQLYKSIRHFEQAAEAFRKLENLRPDNLDFFYEEANMHVLSGNLDEAIDVYDRLEERLGPTDTWTMQKYKIYLNMGNGKAARQEIEAISKAIPGQVKYLEMLAQMCMKEKDYKQAYAYLKRILEISPDDPYIHVSLADYYRNVGNFKQAFHALEKAVTNPNLDFQTKLSVLQAYYTGQDDLKPEGDLIAQALQLFQALNRTHPDEAQGFFIHAKFLILIERGPEALPLLEQALTLDSSAYSTWDLLLYACNMAQDTARMEKYGKAASARFPEQPGPEMYLAIASFLKGDYAAAAEQAQASLGKDFLKNPFLQKVNWQILGDAYFELGKEQESLSAYEHLFRLDPEDRYVRNNYAYYLALTGRELEKAESLAAQLCKEEPGNPTFLDTYGWVLYRKGQYGKALDYVKAALENGSSNDATVLEHYGDILYRLGERRQASEYWEKALQRARKDAAKALEEKIKNPEQWIP